MSPGRPNTISKTSFPPPPPLVLPLQTLHIQSIDMCKDGGAMDQRQQVVWRERTHTSAQWVNLADFATYKAPDAGRPSAPLPNAVNSANRLRHSHCRGEVNISFDMFEPDKPWDCHSQHHKYAKVMMSTPHSVQKHVSVPFLRGPRHIPWQHGAYGCVWRVYVSVGRGGGVRWW
jgi:hypothetical protein